MYTSLQLVAIIMHVKQNGLNLSGKEYIYTTPQAKSTLIIFQHTLL